MLGSLRLSGLWFYWPLTSWHSVGELTGTRCLSFPSWRDDVLLEPGKLSSEAWMNWRITREKSQWCWKQLPLPSLLFASLFLDMNLELSSLAYICFIIIFSLWSSCKAKLLPRVRRNHCLAFLGIFPDTLEYYFSPLFTLVCCLIVWHLATGVF